MLTVYNLQVAVAVGVMAVAEVSMVDVALEADLEEVAIK